jgi:hypothetical protein
MPRKLRAPKRRRAVQVTLDELDIREQLCLLSAWSPGEAGDRWNDWRSFLADYDAVREEMREHRNGLTKRGGDEAIFAERVRLFVAARGMAALEALPTYAEVIGALDEFEGVRR